MKRNKVKVTKRNDLNSKQNRANICKITMAYITGTLNKGIGKVMRGGGLRKSVSVNDIILNSNCEFCIC